jgi:hypothetical protein
MFRHPGAIVVAVAASLARANVVLAQPSALDTGVTAALVRALLPPLAADLGRERPTMGEARPGTPGWGVWEVRAPAAGPEAEEALRRTVVDRTRGRARAPGDSVWLVLAVEGPAEVRSDAAVLRVDRGTRRCSAAGGLTAFGLTYRYEFQRAGTGWTYVRAVPYIAYDPPPPPAPGQARPRCGA